MAAQRGASRVPTSHSPHVLLGFGIHACGRLVQQRDRGVPQHAQGEAQLGGDDKHGGGGGCKTRGRRGARRWAARAHAL